jgi:glucoamylase
MLAMACPSLFGQATNPLAPGAPGRDAHWPSAAKSGFGTANTVGSKVWFTLNNGVMTEAFYPRLDVPNTQTLQLIVCGPRECQIESEDTNHEMRVVNSRALSFQQINKAKDGAYTITKTYTTDPEQATILIHVDIATNGRTPIDVYVYYDPSLNNSGFHDTGWTSGSALFCSDNNIASAMLSTEGFEETTNGFLGTSDGWLQLKRGRTLSEKYERAEKGNVVQVARLGTEGRTQGQTKRFTLALSFGSNSQDALMNARRSLSKGFSRVRRAYEAGWERYLSSLLPVQKQYRRQFNMAAMVLKALEDKTYPGAMIASPSVPWGGGPNANEPTVSGYHGVWSRDLYHVSTAFIAMGDRASANRALDYLFKVQQRPDGSFPQNSWVDGRPIGGGLQMDQVAFPLILANQLNRTDRITWLKHIRPAADFIVRKGPATEQERWEEEAGYSPSTIAAQIAGLVCGSHIAKVNNDVEAAEKYLFAADEWSRTLERWTLTTNGPHGPGRPYYLRITQRDPNANVPLEINSGGGIYDQREIVDAGFLELVRLGIKPANDPAVVDSLKVVDRLIKVSTQNGPAWYRYNHDAYGERADGGDYDGRTGKGRLWTLLTGERGEYELARGNFTAARDNLHAMMKFANDGLMIPEQIWDQRDSARPTLTFGEGTGSATPLAWSMAQFIRLMMNLHAQRNLETPAVVRRRYLKRLSEN